jgi:intracellular multiplication protein IcmD
MKSIVKKSLSFSTLIVCIIFCAICYASKGDLDDMSDHITGSFSAFTKCIIACSYIIGLACAIGAILKHKAHKDNPTQIPIGTPILYSFIAISLLFIPTVLFGVGLSLFGDNASVLGPKGKIYCPQRAEVTNSDSCF